MNVNGHLVALVVCKRMAVTLSKRRDSCDILVAETSNLNALKSLGQFKLLSNVDVIGNSRSTRGWLGT